jgi:hypothetical protein
MARIETETDMVRETALLVLAQEHGLDRSAWTFGVPTTRAAELRQTWACRARRWAPVRNRARAIARRAPSGDALWISDAA